MMELPDYLRLVRRYWAVLLAGLGLGLGSAMFQVESTPKTYTATSTMYVTMATGTSVADSYQGGLAAQQRVRSYLELTTSDYVVDRVIGQLGLDLDRDELRAKVTADTPPATSLLRVSVTDDDPETSRILTDQVVAQFRALVDTLETIELTAAPAARVAVVDAARVPAEASGSGGTRLLVVGGLAGLLFGALAAYLLDRLDKRVRDVAGLEALGQPVLGRVVLGGSGEISDLRSVRARLPRAERIVVTGLGRRAEPRLALGLASVLGATGERVLVVDANTTGKGVSVLLPDPLPRSAAPVDWPVRNGRPRHDPVVAVSSRTTAAVRGEVFDPPTVKLDLRAAGDISPDEPAVAADPPPAELGARAADGLAAVLREDARLEEIFIPWPDRSVTVLALGDADERTPDLLASTRFDAILAEAAKRFDRVVVDTAPADAPAVASKASCTVGVVLLGRDRGDRIASTLTALTGAGASMAGTVAVSTRRNWWR
ncbi:hypothetical protein [Nocardia brevicatena]|uniref:hypothetical protein n=1 Tax=Nocardia brevicatena TaxID=37327 RepID=UPI000A02EF8C|nr:hypothetical protein [Nocardia brevicatena]